MFAEIVRRLICLMSSMRTTLNPRFWASDGYLDIPATAKASTDNNSFIHTFYGVSSSCTMTQLAMQHPRLEGGGLYSRADRSKLSV